MLFNLLPPMVREWAKLRCEDQTINIRTLVPHLGLTVEKFGHRQMGGLLGTVDWNGDGGSVWGWDGRETSWNRGEWLGAFAIIQVRMTVIWTQVIQCSCLENPRDGGAWWAAVYGVTQSWTRLKRLSSSSSNAFRRGLLEEKLQQGLEVVREWAKWVSKKRIFQPWERESTKAPGQSVSEGFKEQWGGLHSKTEWAGEVRGALDEVNETTVIIASGPCRPTPEIWMWNECKQKANPISSWI